LWIEIEQEDTFTQSGECGSQIDGSGRLSHSTFLICDRNYHSLYIGIRNLFNRKPLG